MSGKGPTVALPTPFDRNQHNVKQFLSECELVFEVKPKDWSERDNPRAKIAFVLSWMKTGAAADWAYNYNQQAKIDKLDKWIDFKNLLLEEFKLKHQQEEAQSDLYCMVQGKVPVDQYNQIFNLCVECAGLKNPQTEVFYYLKGLNEQIRRRINSMDKKPTTLSAMQTAAGRFEQEDHNENLIYGGQNKPLFANAYLQKIQGIPIQTVTYASGSQNNPIIVNCTKTHPFKCLL